MRGMLPKEEQVKKSDLPVVLYGMAIIIHSITSIVHTRQLRALEKNVDFWADEMGKEYKGLHKNSRKQYHEIQDVKEALFRHVHSESRHVNPQG